MSNPNYKRLGDIVNFKRGYDLPVQDRIEGPFPIISSSGISGYHDQYKVEGEGLVTGRYGTLGKMHYVNGKYWPHNTALYATDFKGNYPKYIYYLMTCLGNLKTSDKSAVPGINRNDLHELNIPFINPDQQKPIADLLWSLDSKIELNNRINAELEAMAKTIYDYWFVQFDFPISKELATQMGKPQLEGRPYKSSGGKMVYNKELKREVPEGWEVKYVEEILVKQKAPKKIPTSDYLENGKVPIIDQSRDFICGYTNDLHAKIIADTPQIVFGDHTRILKLINFDFARGADGTQVLQSGEEKVPQHYFFHALSKIDLSNYGYARHFKFLKQSKVLVPALEIVNSFEKMVTPFFEKIRHSIFENRELASLRDWLLPMLMNGQVKVGEAKEYVQEEKLDRDRVGMAAERQSKYEVKG